MNLVHVEIEDSFVGTDENVLVTRVRVDPRRGTIDMKWTAIENFRKTRAHQHLNERNSRLLTNLFSINFSPLAWAVIHWRLDDAVAAGNDVDAYFFSGALEEYC